GCGERSGGCERRARASLVRRSSATPPRSALRSPLSLPGSLASLPSVTRTDSCAAGAECGERDEGWGAAAGSARNGRVGMPSGGHAAVGSAGWKRGGPFVAAKVLRRLPLVCAPCLGFAQGLQEEGARLVVRDQRLQEPHGPAQVS